jgi:hypothetical protein
VVYTKTGQLKFTAVSHDGRTGHDVEPTELWKMWTLLAANLADNCMLSAPKRLLCRAVVETVREALRRTQECA